jgi:hypothetical protein
MVYVLLQLVQIRVVGRHCSRQNGLSGGPSLKETEHINDASSLLVILITHSHIFPPTGQLATSGLKVMRILFFFRISFSCVNVSLREIFASEGKRVN